MDSREPWTKRVKKSDKAKEKHDRNGNFSQKRVRQLETIMRQERQRPDALNVQPKAT